MAWGRHAFSCHALSSLWSLTFQPATAALAESRHHRRHGIPSFSNRPPSVLSTPLIKPGSPLVTTRWETQVKYVAVAVAVTIPVAVAEEVAVPAGIAPVVLSTVVVVVVDVVVALVLLAAATICTITTSHYHGH